MASTSLTYVGPIPRGRPSSYTDETAEAICERLTQGESLLSITRDDDMPGLTTVYQWMDAHPEFAKNYARARARQATVQAEEILEIADDPTILPEHKRLMIDARKWRAARQNWRAWGDRMQHEHTVPDQPTAVEPGSLPGSLQFLVENSGSDEG